MEVSYYIECQSIEGYYNPTCLTADIRLAVFTFAVQFQESNELWPRIEPLLMKSFGRLEIILSSNKIETGSLEKRKRKGRSLKKLDKTTVKIHVEMKPVRNSAQDIEELLTDERTACMKFLGFDSTAKFGDSCWNENTKEIFSGEEIDFLGVNLLWQNKNSSNDALINPIAPVLAPPTYAATKSDPNLTSLEEPSTTIRSIQSTSTTDTSTQISFITDVTSSSTTVTQMSTTTKITVPITPKNGSSLTETSNTTIFEKKSSFSWCYSWCKSNNYTHCALAWNNYPSNSTRQCKWLGV